MAKEYIERKAVIERLKKSIKWCENELELGEFRRGCIASLRDEIGNIKHSEVIPTADVVEVVRCKDCINFGECVGMSKDGVWARCSIHGRIWCERDFCSYGARMDGKDGDA